MIVLARSNAILIVLLIALISTIQPFQITKLESHRQFKGSRINRALHRVQLKPEGKSKLLDIESKHQDGPSASNSIIQTSALMFLLSAPLGMMLDNYHGKQLPK